MTKVETCPCGSLKNYENCCEMLISGKIKAETAEQLMRSRYTAFSKGAVDYLLSTWHPTRSQENNRLSLLATIEKCQWLSLKILNTTKGQAEDQEGYVEFLAIFQEETLGAMQERSRFVKEEGEWFYLEGEHRKPALPARNDPCWCGSGKKTKKCHGVIT